jgi:hypothetical protein
VSTCLRNGRIAPPHVGQLGLPAQFRPDLLDRFRSGLDEVDAAISDSRRIPLGFGVPDLLDLEQSTVAPAHVVLAELERRAPTGAFEFTTIRLLENGAVLALTQQSLAGCRKGSGDHDGHLPPPTLWNVSADWV